MTHIENYRTPYDDEPGISELEDAVLLLLERAGIDPATNDKIINLINAAERRIAALDEGRGK